MAMVKMIRFFYKHKELSTKVTHLIFLNLYNSRYANNGPVIWDTSYIKIEIENGCGINVFELVNCNIK